MYDLLEEINWGKKGLKLTIIVFLSFSKSDSNIFSTS